MNLALLDPTTPGIVDQTTGEVIPLEPDALSIAARENPDALAAYIRMLDEAKRELDALRAEIGQHLIDRMDADATQTLHTESCTITVNGGSDEVTEYDAEKLHSALAGLVAEGVLSELAVAKAVKVKREVSKSGLNSLRALNHDGINAAIYHAEETRTRPRRVTVKASA